VQGWLVRLYVTRFQAFETNLWFVARVIQEELLKDLANRSEMSDWFNREDTPKTSVPLVTRPNPKNIQNATKIEELEQQIKRYAFKRTPKVNPTADNICVPGCKQNDSLWKHSSDHHQYPTCSNAPIRKPRLRQISLSSQPPMLKYSTP
jgi:hypothetical protein